MVARITGLVVLCVCLGINMVAFMAFKMMQLASRVRVTE